MIRLHQFSPAWGLPSPSAFCMKVETYLRMTALPYETVAGDLRKAPKGKLPYIEDGGQVVADSGLILDYLKATYGDPLDAELSPSERAAGLAFKRLLEEHTYWAAIYSRWMEPRGWELTRPAFFGSLPFIARDAVARLARRSLRQQLRGQGMGRHGRDEIYALGCDDIGAVASFLGQKPFFLGDDPTSVDATVYAFMANLLWGPHDSPLKRHAAALPQLEAYCERMKRRYFPEYP